MKKLKLYSGIGLLSTFCIAVNYFIFADIYGLGSTDAFYATLLISITLFIVNFSLRLILKDD